jgi:hypothetical protein
MMAIDKSTPGEITISETLRGQYNTKVNPRASTILSKMKRSPHEDVARKATLTNALVGRNI